MGRCRAQEREFSRCPRCLPHRALEINRQHTERVNSGGSFPASWEVEAQDVLPAMWKWVEDSSEKGLAGGEPWRVPQQWHWGSDVAVRRDLWSPWRSGRSGWRERSRGHGDSPGGSGSRVAQHGPAVPGGASGSPTARLYASLGTQNMGFVACLLYSTDPGFLYNKNSF